jgi:hypothetical protein
VTEQPEPQALSLLLENLRVVIQEVAAAPECLIDPGSRAAFLRAASDIDARFDRIATDPIWHPPTVLGDGYGLAGDELGAKLQLFLQTLERYRDERAVAGLPVQRRVKEATEHAVDRLATHVRPSGYRKVRRWLSKVVGVASPILGSFAAALIKAAPGVSEALEGVGEICDYIGGACDYYDD